MLPLDYWVEIPFNFLSYDIAQNYLQVMANDTLPVGIIVEVDHPRASFLGKITEVSSTHVLDDVWYRVEPIPGEKDQQNSKGWYHMKHISEIDLLTQS